MTFAQNPARIHPRRDTPGRTRGFVGPLGDDIPSIFPIVAAVLLFIGTLAYANGLVQGKNRILDTRQAALGLSYIVTEKGLIDKSDEFEKITCEDHLKKYALSNQVKFLVTVKRYCDSIQFYYPRNSPQPEEAKLSPDYLEKTPTQPAPGQSGVLQGHTWTYCTNAKDAKENAMLAVPENAVVLTYPVAVPCPKVPAAGAPPNSATIPTDGLGLINVIAWKQNGQN